MSADDRLELQQIERGALLDGLAAEFTAATDRLRELATAIPAAGSDGEWVGLSRERDMTQARLGPLRQQIEHAARDYARAVITWAAHAISAAERDMNDANAAIANLNSQRSAADARVVSINPNTPERAKRRKELHRELADLSERNERLKREHHAAGETAAAQRGAAKQKVRELFGPNVDPRDVGEGDIERFVKSVTPDAA